MSENLKISFGKLAGINVNEHSEKKNGLTYLSWSWAWDQFKRVMPDASYTVWRDEAGRPYIHDETLGYMVFVSVTAGVETHSMWLPVMDGANKAQKSVDYEYETRSGTKRVVAATMFDINTSLMRCLVKCLAMFGLGLYIYAGEDIPVQSDEDKAESASYAQLKAKLVSFEKRYKGVIALALSDFDGVTRVQDLPAGERDMFLKQVEGLVIEHEKKAE